MPRFSLAPFAFSLCEFLLTLLLLGDKVFIMDSNRAVDLSVELKFVRVENLNLTSSLDTQQCSDD
jgi:hypothetical protein